MLELLASGGITGIMGLLGGLSQRWMDLKLAKEKFALQKHRLDMQYKEASLEAQTSLQMTTIKTEATTEQELLKAETEANKQSSMDLRAAMAADKASYSKEGMAWWHPMVLVDFSRGMIRQIITIWSLWLMHTISNKIGLTLVLETLTDEQKFEMAQDMVQAIIALVFLCVGFYFGQKARHDPVSARKRG